MALLRMDMSRMLLLTLAVLVVSQCSVEARVPADDRLRLRRDAAAEDSDVSGYVDDAADYAMDTGDKDVDYFGDKEDNTNNTDVGSTYDGPPVNMKSVGQTFQVTKGESVWLNCETENGAPTIVIAWKKKPDSMLYQGSIHVGVNPRTTRFKNQTLLIKNVTEDDAGTYSCDLLGKGISVEYVVEVIIPVKIVRMLPLEGNRRIREGHPVELVCEAEGLPAPYVKWSKNGSRIDQGYDSNIEVRSHSLYFTSVKKEHDGTYQCLAENVIKDHDHGFVTIQVLHAPTVHTHHEAVNGAEGMEVELSCIVHSEPASVVTWLKDGQPLPEDDANLQLLDPETLDSTQATKQKFSLFINSVRPSDFGKYTCEASNEHGQHHRSIRLVRHPALVAAGAGDAHNQSEPQLKWTFHSQQNVTELDVQYKKIDEKDWVSVTPDQQVMNGTLYILSKKVNLPVGRYEARARVRNQHGWSERAYYHFKEEETAPGNDYRNPNVPVDAVKEKSSADRQTVSSLLSTVVMCLLVRLA